MKSSSDLTSAGPPCETAGIHAAIGAQHLEGGRLEEAEASYRKALEIDPDFADAHFKLGNIATKRRAPAAAEAAYRRAVSADSCHFKALYNLGNLLRLQTRLGEAETCYRRVIEIEPGYVNAYVNLGVTLKDLGRPTEAETCYRAALQLEPNDAETLSNLSVVLKEQGRLDEAEASCRRSLQLSPRNALAYNNLGVILKDQGRLVEAEASYRNALKLAPNYAEAHNNLGVVLKEQGELGAAVAHYRNALSINPDYTNAHSNLLLGLCYSDDHTPSQYLQQAIQFGEMAAARTTGRFDSWLCPSHPDRLRVDMVSGDLRDHPVGYFLEGLLTHIDPSRIELIAYPTQISESNLTDRIRGYFSAWKPVVGMNDKDAANLIQRDGVHILIDLAGHTAHNRLPVFAWKPAPLQVSWLGYFAATGMAEIDYVLADRIGVPDEYRSHFNEEVWYLPDTRLCFSIPQMSIPVSHLPALRNGVVTFGCFQNLSKLNDKVLQLWSKILVLLPGAQIRFQHGQLRSKKRREGLLRCLQEAGIPDSRVTMHDGTSYEQYMAAYSEVDIILDTFPFPGGTTTCEALWMGVPTLTLNGSSLIQRQGASLLASASLPRWIACNENEYILKAIAFATNLESLDKLRLSLRQQVLASPLFDATRFARNFEDALWNMWQRHHQCR